MKTILATASICLLSAIMFCASCKKTPKDENWYKEMSTYVSAHTSGAIGRSEPVKIVFAQATNGIAGQVVASGVAQITPRVEGAWTWESDRSMVFTPKKPFDSGSKYQVAIRLDKLFPKVPSAFKTFDFGFEVRLPSLHVEVMGVQAKQIYDLKSQQVVGVITTNEQVDPKQLESALKADQGGKALPVLWRHEDSGKTHHFIIDDVVRGNAPSTVQIAWDARPIGGKQTGSSSVSIPSLGDFVVLDTRVEHADKQSIILNFSDPILADQDLSGLIRIKDHTGNLSYQIAGNFVTIFTDAPLEGEYELTVESGIKNIAGARLTNGSTHSINFDDQKPSVQILGNGVILPAEANGDVLMPFVAVGINAVDVEVFKIFQSNILQFLQTNDLEGNQELERVGRVVLQKKVSLSELSSSANARVKQRYALNLRDLIAQDPGAIYQIRLAFRRGYTNLPCAQKDAQHDDLSHLNQTDEYGNLKSLFGDYRGIYEFDGYAYEVEADSDYDENQYYNYEERGNPCAKEYYNSEHFAQRNLFVSNIGLMAKSGKDKSLFVVATKLRTAEPLSGAELEIYDYQLQKILTTNTNGDGIARIENLPSKPYIVVARSGSDRGYVRMYDGNSLSLSSFDVAGVEPQKGLKGYLYGERGVWRPGDSLYLNFVLEPQNQQVPPNFPLTFELFDASGKLQFRHVATQSVSGVYPLHCATSASAPTGTWQAKVMVGGATFIEPIRVETVKPNRLKINLDFAGQKAFYAGTKGGTGQLQVNWLHGAPGKHLKTRVEMQIQPMKTAFTNFKEYDFDDPTRQINTEPEVIYEGQTNESGRASVQVKLASVQTAPGKLSANIKVRAFEPGGEFSTDQFAMDYFPYDYFVGVRIPKSAYGSPTIDQQKGGDVHFAVVDRQGNPVANRSIQVGVYRLNWQWWWDSYYEGSLAQYNGTTHMGAVQQLSLTTDSKGIAKFTVKTNQWGRYLVRAIDPIGGHSSGSFFWTGYPEDAQMSSRNAAAMLPFTADKDKYVVGEMVTLRIPASEQGRILVSLEDGERVIDHIWKEATKGDNTITFRAGAEMAPNLYAHVSLFQPHEQTKNDLPIRMYGIIPVMIENPEKQLQPQLQMPDEIKPEKPFTVEISESKGRACTYTLALVDDGLLDLTRFKTPDAYAAFHQKEALGVTTWDLYDHVLGAYATGVERIMSIGGDAFNTSARAGAQVNRFKPAVVHIGPFRLERGQKAKHTLQLTNYVGSVRAMLVCNDVGKAYGSAEKTVPVKQPLMIMPTLPRVLGPGETLRLPVEVFAMEQKIKQASVAVKEIKGLVQVLSGAKQLAFSQPGQQMTSFDIKAGNQTGAAKFVIEAQGNGERATQEIEIEIRNPNPLVTNVVSGLVEPGQTWSGTLNSGSFTDMENATIEVSVLPSLHVGKHLDYLIRYPHGCVEQTTSGAFPQLYVEGLVPLSDKQKMKVQKHITAAVEKLRSYQTGGGFSYWPGESAINDWTTSYVGHFLLEAKNKGYTVPEHVISAWKTYQTNAARQWNANTGNLGYDDNEMCQAYRLYTLALAGAPSLADMNRLLERQKMFPSTAAMLSSAYTLAAKPEAGKKIMDKFAEGQPRSYDWYGNTYGSTLRDDALILEAYTLLKHPKASTYAEKLMRIGDDSYYHTSELSTALRALSKYAASQSGSSGISCSYAVNGQQERTLKTTRFIGMEDISDIHKASNIHVRNTSQGKLYVTVTYNGRPVEEREPATAQGIAATVRYVDAKGQAIDFTKLKQGTDFFAEVEIKRQPGHERKNMKDLALSHVFPSGWEILTSRMGNVQADGGSGPIRYRDIRDDRVLTYFDLGYQGQKDPVATYRIQLNAAYPGRYYLPAVSCEAMYDRQVRTVVPGRWVEVI